MRILLTKCQEKKKKMKENIGLVVKYKVFFNLFTYICKKNGMMTRLLTNN